jgi:hypothetical protein
MDGVEICDVGRRLNAHAINQRPDPLFLWRYDRYKGYGSARLLRAHEGPAARMKLTADRPFADPEKAARKLLEIANATEAVQDGRIYIEKINAQFLFKEGGTPAEYRAALAYTVAKGWLWKHESGTYVKFTPAGAELFA